MIKIYLYKFLLPLQIMDYDHFITYLPPSKFILTNNKIQCIESPNPIIMHKYFHGLLSEENKKQKYDDVKNKNICINIAINGGGFRVTYLTLVMAYIIRKTNLNIVQISGVSSGFLCGILSMTNAAYNINKFLFDYDRVRKSVNFDKYDERHDMIMLDDSSHVVNFIIDGLKEYFCDIERFNKNLITRSIKLTPFGPKEILHREYKDIDDLKSVFKATSSIPYLTNKKLVHLHQNEFHVDGAMSYLGINHPVFDFDNDFPILFLNQEKIFIQTSKTLNPEKNFYKTMVKGMKHFLTWMENDTTAFPFKWVYTKKTSRNFFDFISGGATFVALLFLYYIV